MEAILKYNLDEHDDRTEHLAAIKASSMAFVLWQVQKNLRKHIENKIDSGELTSSQQTIDAVMDYINNEMDMHNINIEELTY